MVHGEEVHDRQPRGKVQKGRWSTVYEGKLKPRFKMIHLICFQYLKTHLSPWNVLDTYAFAEQYGEVHILYQCLRLIDKNAGYVFASPGFNSLPMRLVKALAGRTTLSAREVPVPDRSDIRAFSLFFTLQSWAKGVDLF